MLQRIQPALPSFGVANWQSNIHGYARAHPEYIAISSWGGSETADITYRDDNGALTSFLVDKGYLEGFDVERLRQAKPLYYLEVKSTPYPYETSFFMSNKQYRRVSLPGDSPGVEGHMLTWSQMQGYSQSGPGQEDSVDSVYVIMREFKFNLGKDSANVRVLVDPEGMRRRGELYFEAESWRVRPTVE